MRRLVRIVRIGIIDPLSITHGGNYMTNMSCYGNFPRVVIACNCQFAEPNSSWTTFWKKAKYIFNPPEFFGLA